MELSILHAIQSIRTPGLDKIIVLIFNTILGSKGQLWVYLGILLLLFPKTRKCGITVLISYLLAYFTGDLLKDLIARPRPFTVDSSVDMIVSKSTSYSCPSVHSALAFACAASIFFQNRKWGIPVLIFAGLTALSRLYFFVHYPTDVLFGSILGFFIGWAIFELTGKISKSRKSKS